MNSNKHNYLVSVVIPTFNRPDTLNRAITNVLLQTVSDVEIIVVDDCSEKDISDVIESFDGSIKYIRHDKNKGACAARNTGILAATGKYIAFLDDDDLWVTNKLEKQLKLMPYYEACLCGYTNSNNGVDRVQNTNYVTLKMLSHGNSFCGNSGLMVHSEVIKSELFDETLPKSQDWDIYVRLAKRKPIGYVAEALFEYSRDEHNSITNSTREIGLKDIDKILLALYKHRGIMEDYVFKRRLASSILAYIGSKRKKLNFLAYAIQQAGLLATCHILLLKGLGREWKKV